MSQIYDRACIKHRHHTISLATFPFEDADHSPTPPDLKISRGMSSSGSQQVKDTIYRESLAKHTPRQMDSKLVTQIQHTMLAPQDALSYCKKYADEESESSHSRKLDLIQWELKAVGNCLSGLSNMKMNPSDSEKLTPNFGHRYVASYVRFCVIELSETLELSQRVLSSGSSSKSQDKNFRRAGSKVWSGSLPKLLRERRATSDKLSLAEHPNLLESYDIMQQLASLLFELGICPLCKSKAIMSEY